MEIDYNVKLANDNPNKIAVILIHGFGANKDDLFSLTNYLPKDFDYYAIQGIYKMDYYGRNWYNIEWVGNDKKVNIDQAKNSLNEITNFIKDLKEKNNYNSICLLGFSQGAILSYAIAFQMPQLIEKIICLSGYFDERIQKLEINEEIKKLKIFISHGEYDEVIPIEQAIETSKKLNELNINHYFKKYDIAHSINEEILKDLQIWLNENP